jgi:hypothetical protein
VHPWGCLRPASPCFGSDAAALARRGGRRDERATGLQSSRGRLHLRDDAAWLAELLMDLEDDKKPQATAKRKRRKKR